MNVLFDSLISPLKFVADLSVNGIILVRKSKISPHSSLFLVRDALLKSSLLVLRRLFRVLIVFTWLESSEDIKLVRNEKMTVADDRGYISSVSEIIGTTEFGVIISLLSRSTKIPSFVSKPV